MDHLVFVRPATARLLAQGLQTCESRLSKCVTPAWRVRADDTLYFKVSGGDGVLAARAASVDRYDGLRPGDVDALRDLYGRDVDGPVPDTAYWRDKRLSRYAVFARLADVRPWRCPKALLPTSMSAWIAGFTPPPGCGALGSGSDRHLPRWERGALPVVLPTPGCPA